jgi:hypothetical protein
MTKLRVADCELRIYGRLWEQNSDPYPYPYPFPFPFPTPFVNAAAISSRTFQCR